MSPTAALRRALTREDAETIAESLISRAKAGDMIATRLLLDRLDGPQSGPLAVALAQASARGDVLPMPEPAAVIVIQDNHRGDRPNSVPMHPSTRTTLPPSPSPSPPEPEPEPEPDGDEVEAEPNPPGVMSGSDFLKAD